MNTDKIYQVDHYKLLIWLTPNKIKQARINAFLTGMAYPLALLYNSFVLFRKQKLYQLMITPQKCYLTRLLNDRFDFTARRIYIDDGIDKPPFYIFRSAELKPKYIRRRGETAPKFIYSGGESSALKYDFVVFVPAAVLFDMQEMASLIKVYKLAGVKFKIQRF